MASSKINCEKPGHHIKIEESIHPVTVIDTETDMLEGTLPAIISRITKVNGQVSDVEIIPIRIQAV